MSKIIRKIMIDDRAQVQSVFLEGLLKCGHLTLEDCDKYTLLGSMTSNKNGDEIILHLCEKEPEKAPKVPVMESVKRKFKLW